MGKVKLPMYVGPDADTVDALLYHMYVVGAPLQI